MENEKKEETAEVEETPEKNVIEEAKDIMRRNEEAVRKMAELVARNENLVASNILGGHSDSNQETAKKEITPEEYAKQALNGQVGK